MTWQTTLQRGESCLECMLLLIHADRSSACCSKLFMMGTSASRADERRGRARVTLEPLLQDLQLPALPEVPPDAQLPEGAMASPDSTSVAEDDLPTSVKALLGPLLALTSPLRAQLITALKSKDFDPNDIPFGNTAEFDQFLKTRFDQARWSSQSICQQHRFLASCGLSCMNDQPIGCNT